MRPLEVLGQVVKLRREQQSLTQAALAERLGGYGMTVDPTAIVRIEKGARDVRVDELLALAAALDATPAEMLAPLYAHTLTVGDHELTASQVLEWFGGNREALIRPFLRSLQELRDEAQESEMLSHLIEGVALISEAIDRKDRAAFVRFAAYTQETLARVLDWSLTSEDLARIAADYDIPEGT